MCQLESDLSEQAALYSRGGGNRKGKGYTTLRVVSREDDSRKSPEGWKATLVTGPECAE